MSATPSERVPLSELVRTPYIQALTYPRISLPAARSRVNQLRRLGVQELIFEGRTKIGRLGLLGLGTVGVVVKARVDDEELALKIRRTDANRPSMEGEARLTSFANRIGVGPEVRGHTKDLLLMELVTYVELHQWLAEVGGAGTRVKVRDMVHKVLNQCRKLDIVNLDHGQLSDLRKHIVLEHDEPRILDFESASRERRPRNVTAAAQYLLVGGMVSPKVRRLLGMKDSDGALSFLRAYKKSLSDYDYAKLLEYLRIPAV